MGMFRFSANLGYLWGELPFLDRIRAAADHGFDGVEFHDEAQTTDRVALRAVLAETGLPVYGLNVRMGDTIGCAAIPDMKDQARRNLDHAIEIAQDIGAGAIHVLSGVTSAPGASDAYLESLGYALEQSDCTILIEPICAEQIPGYHLRTIDQAADVLTQLSHPRLKIMFDCYHIHVETGDVAGKFATYADQIGHVQIAAAEARGAPYPGALDYAQLLPEFQAAGYAGAFGCEYRPAQSTAASLGWRDAFR